MALAATAGFEENHSQTSAQLNELLQKHPELLTDNQIKERGVFLNENHASIALDFDKAATYFNISSLP